MELILLLLGALPILITFVAVLLFSDLLVEATGRLTGRFRGKAQL
jgi:hypothetical protein